jgi:DNA-binding Lrp family transcriptional regulator
MKKQTLEDIAYQKRTTLKKLARRVRIENRATKEKRKLNKKRKNNATKRGISTYKLTIPETVCISLEKHRTPLLRSLRKLREKVFINKIHVRLNFSGTTKLIPDGAIILLAELTRIIELKNPNVSISCIPARNDKVNQALTQIGLYKLLGKKHHSTPKDHDVIKWRVACGHDADGERYDDVLGHYDGEITTKMQSKLFIGITESMTNTKQHAHEASRDDESGVSAEDDLKNWWMFSQEKDGSLHVVFCDLGIGIPRSLPLGKRRAIVRLFDQATTKDSTYIATAVEDSESRTKQSHRGKGLAQLVRIAESFDGAKLLIHSNKGWYNASNGESNASDFKDSILGTVILLQVPLK